MGLEKLGKDWGKYIGRIARRNNFNWENDDKWLGRNLDCCNLLGMILGTVRIFGIRKLWDIFEEK